METDSITLEDVEIAIKVLETFLRKMKRAEILLSRVRRYQTGYMRYPTSFEDFINIALQMQKSKRTEEEVETTELTKEELERLRKIKEKIKKL